MRRLIYVLAAFATIAACGGTKVEEPQILPLNLTVDKSKLEFTAAGGSKEFTASAQDEPDLSPWDGWVSLKKGDWDNHTVTVTVTAEPNETTQERSTKVAVVSGDQKLYVEVIQAAGSGSGDNGNTTTDPVPQPEDNPAWKIAAKLGLGWNLGNHFDAHVNGVSGETAWGNPKATAETFKMVKAAGFSTVRIPVTWLGHIGEAPDYKIEDAWLDRIAEVVGYAEQAGLNVILNIHHDGADSQYWLDIVTAALNPEVHQQIIEQIEAMWSQIAWKFQDKGDFLIFEAFNEIHDGKWGWGANRTDGGKQYKCLNEWNQAFVGAVRGAGGQNNMERILGIPAYCTNIDIAIETLEMPSDHLEDRLMVSVHCYDPSDYTLTAKYSEWGHTGSANKAPGDNEGDLKKNFVKLYNHYVSKGIPVYLGEFGCANRANIREQAFQQYYLKYFGKLAKDYGVPAIIWDNGARGSGNERHAFIDHGTGAYCSPEAESAIKALVKSYSNEDPNYTLEAIYNNAPR